MEPRAVGEWHGVNTGLPWDDRESHSVRAQVPGIEIIEVAAGGWQLLMPVLGSAETEIGKLPW